MKNFHEVKSQLTKWEKMLVHHISDKGFVSKIYDEHLQFNNKKVTNPIKKWTKVMKRNFPKEDTRMGNKQMKILSISLIIKEMEIKAIRHHLIYTKMTKIR